MDILLDNMSTIYTGNQERRKIQHSAIHQKFKIASGHLNKWCYLIVPKIMYLYIYNYLSICLSPESIPVHFIVFK